MSQDIMVVVATLPHDHVGLVTGRHLVAEYHFVGRNIPPFGFRVTIEAYPGGGFHLFNIDYFDQETARPMTRMCSFPSKADCYDHWLARKK